MKSLGRYISVLGRKKDSIKDRHRVLDSFVRWRTLQERSLQPVATRHRTLLIIRLDDIGDYLLFRNQLSVYKNSERWRDHTITLLGNEAWRDLFMGLDLEAVDSTIWVHKNRYLEDAAYRLALWQRLRERGFAAAVAPSRTRPLLLDDLCVLAAAAPERLGCANTNVHTSWNELSDRLYTALFTTPHVLQHEFYFNAEFSSWLCGIRSAATRPHIEGRFSLPTGDPYVICFVGASTRSKRWPIRRWIQFIARYNLRHDSRVILAGNGRTELDMVRLIRKSAKADTIAGTVGLLELLPWVAGARAIITNDTVAAHLGASFERPTVIISNGVNYMRFAEYRDAGMGSVATVYPEVVSRRRRHGDGQYAYSETVSADIASISAAAVMEALDGLLGLA